MNILIFDGIQHESILRYPDLLNEVLFVFLLEKYITVPAGKWGIVLHPQL